MTGAATTNRSASLPAFGLVAAGSLAFLWALREAWPFTADDAYITFRHARHLIEGHGPSFGTSGAPIEGITSFAWMLVSALPLLVSMDPALFAKGVGVASAVAAAFGAWKFAATYVKPSGAIALAPAFAFAASLGHYATAVHAVSGMETSFASAVVTWALLDHRRAAVALGPVRPRAYLLWLVAGLCRPELNVLALGAIAWEMWRAKGAPGQRGRVLRSAALFYLLPGAVYFLSRWAYFGHLLPIPFYAKVRGGDVLPGLDSVLVFAQAMLTAVGFPLGVGLLRRGTWALAAAVALVCALALFPDPVMNFDHRYCAALIPALFVVAGVGLETTAGWFEMALKPTDGRKGLIRMSLALLAVLTFAAGSLNPAIGSLRERRAYGTSLSATLVPFGQALDKYRRESGRRPLLAMGDIGAVGYFSEWNILDTHGLNEPTIALKGSLDPSYVMAQQPDLVGVVSSDARQFRAHWASLHDQALYDACTAAGMRPAIILSFSAASFTFVMARPESDLTRFLQHAYLGRPR